MTIPYNDRFDEYAVKAEIRPKRYYRYWVTGRGEFPADMLRHDAAWPYTGDDAAKLNRFAYNGAERSIRIASHSEPTIDRWSSFGWSVSKYPVVA